jgi:hypothetical protein
MKKFLANHIWWITMLLALAMLIAHTASFDLVRIDNISIILLLVMLLSPFVTAITKIKIVEFEAEVNPEEVRRIKEEVSTQLRDTDDVTLSPGIENTIESIEGMVNSDPVLALAKLRIELEKTLARLYRMTNKEAQRQRLSAGQLVTRLANAEVLSSSIARSIREVISICNRAIHGEDIRQQDARYVVEAGAMLLRELFSQIHEYTFKPVQSVRIDPSIVEEFQNAKYRVTTVIPIIDAPYKDIRIVDQDGLDELLEGYNTYAEFVVEVVKIDS